MSSVEPVLNDHDGRKQKQLISTNISLTSSDRSNYNICQGVSVEK